MIKTPHNSCWLWSSFRIAEAYCKRYEIPKDLHSELIKKYINHENIIIDKYDDNTAKDGDIDNFNCGNAVEYLTLNGIYYDNSLIVTPQTVKANITKTLFDLPIIGFDDVYAILIQLIGHFQTVIKEDDGYWLYDQSSNSGFKRKINIINNQLMIPVNRNFTILYLYKDKEANKNNL